MKARTFLTLAVSAVFLVLAVWNFHFDEFWAVLRHLNPLYFLPALAAYFCSFLFRTLRWQVMLKPTKAIPARSLFRYLVIGYMANNLLPARLGEIVRAYVTGNSESMSRSAAFASVLIERLFDGLTIVMILIVLMLFAGLGQGWLHTTAWISASLFVGGLFVLYLMSRYRNGFMAISERMLKRLPGPMTAKLNHILQRFVTGLSLLYAPRAFFLSLAMSFFVWASEVMVYIVYLKAFEIEAPITAACLALVVVNLSSLIPSSPSYIGVFQYACIAALEIFGVGATAAFTFSVAVHSTQVIPITLLGLYFLSRMGLSLGEIRKAKLNDGSETAN